MPEKATLKKARAAKRAGKSPSTQAGAFVHEEIEHVREGKHGARSTEQAIAIGLSKARRAGVKLPPPPKAKASRRRRAASSRSTVTTKALSRHAKTAARRRPAAARKRSAQKAARTRRRNATAGASVSEDALRETDGQPSSRGGGCQFLHRHNPSIS